MNPALRRSAAHVFVEVVDAPVLSAEDTHHLVRVLRLRAGEAVSVSNGAGSWRMCAFTAEGTLVPNGEVHHDEPPRPPLTVGFALAKGDRPDWIVQKLTEIGIDRILLVDAARNIVRWDAAKAGRNLERLNRVAREASMQSRRTRLPDIAGPFTVAQVTGAQVAGAQVTGAQITGAQLASDGVAVAEPDGGPVGLAVHTVLIGPEGGWAPEELEAARTTVGLGSTILRVETAAIVAATRLTAAREGLATL